MPTSNNDGVSGSFDALTVFSIRYEVACRDLLPEFRWDDSHVGKLTGTSVLPRHIASDARLAETMCRQVCQQVLDGLGLFFP